jgi:transmembrane sensor
MSSTPLSDDDFDRLARLVAGEGDVHERAETERWVALDPERRAALEAMRLGWRTPLPETRANVDAAWGVLSSRIHGAAHGPSSHAADGAAPRADSTGPLIRSTTPPTVRAHRERAVARAQRRWWQDGARLLQVAAAAVVLIGGALILPRMRTAGDVTGTAELAAASSVSTAAGERRTLRLPDGSTVTLGVSSTLRARAGYGDGPREVELEGEAFFTVTHDEAHPFRVFVNGTVVEDLGTEFAVRSYGSAAPIRVAVASGSVAVRRGTTADTAVVLSPSDVATVAETGEVAVRRGVNVAPFTAFASGRLIFADAPLADVAEELTRWYGVEVRVAGAALLDRHLTSTFEGESLDEVLRIIGMTLDVRYTRNGNMVEFSEKARTSSRPPAPTPPAPSAALAEAGA